MRIKLSLALVTCAVVCAAPASAHVSVQSGPGFADTTTIIEFGVGHGCAGADTYAVTIDIPAGFTSVRPMFSDFGATSVTLNGADVTSVTWQKDDAALLPTDSNFYKLAIRMKPPKSPFTIAYFKAHQTCKDGNGMLTTEEWTALPGEMGNAAAALTIVPKRAPGWNKFTMPDHIDDALLPTFFGDALIVWRGSDAFSNNPSTMDLIKATSGVKVISGGVHPDDEVWVRY